MSFEDYKLPEFSKESKETKTYSDAITKIIEIDNKNNKIWLYFNIFKNLILQSLLP